MTTHIPRCPSKSTSTDRIVVTLLDIISMSLYLCSFGLDKSNHGLMNGKRMCDVPLTLSITGSWLARKIHMMKPSTGTFHSHNFRVVSSFILHGVFPAYV